MKYVIKKEMLGGEYYWMIYKKSLIFGFMFLERWNTLKSAEVRLNELRAK